MNSTTAFHTQEQNHPSAETLVQSQPGIGRIARSVEPDGLFVQDFNGVRYDLRDFTGTIAFLELIAYFEDEGEKRTGTMLSLAREALSKGLAFAGHNDPGGILDMVPVNQQMSAVMLLVKKIGDSLAANLDEANGTTTFA